MATRLFLQRHGEAKSADEDPLRGLTDDGKAAVATLANHLKSNGIQCRAVYHSGKLRAEQTAILSAAAMAPGCQPQQMNGLNPNNPPREIVGQIKQWREDSLIVSHLPLLAKLAALLVVGDEDLSFLAFPPGAMVCLVTDDHQSYFIEWVFTPDMCLHNE